MRPPPPFEARPATPRDAEAIAAVVNACDAAFSPVPAPIGEHDVRRWLERAVAMIAVVGPNGEIVACGGGMLRGDVLVVDSSVRPEATGRGLGSFLLGWSEEQARVYEARALRVSAPAGDERAKELVQARGLRHVRSFYRMVIHLTGPPPPPQWPSGIEVAPLGEGEERLLFEAVEESFADHWGHVPRSFDEWRERTVLEPELTFLAHDGGEIAGAVICNEDLFGGPLVGILGVRRRWRGRGLGRALLLQGFAALYAKGKRRIGLGVDAGNETGAVELYRSVGMRVGAQEDVYELPL